MKDYFIRALNLTTSFFAFFVVLVSLVISFITKENEVGLFPSMIFGLYAVSAVIGSATVFYTESKLNAFIKYLIHLVLTLTSFALLFGFVNVGLKGGTVLVATVVIGIIHVCIFSITAIISNAGKKPEKYEDIYKKTE